MHYRTTPEHITILEKNQIFVFGSNLSGYHLGGAAQAAYLNFGAKWGQAVGVQGNSYAIPTIDANVVRTLSTGEILTYVHEFMDWAGQFPEYDFLVTPIGCGIAGLKVYDVAPLFMEAYLYKNIWLPESFWNYLRYN